MKRQFSFPYNGEKPDIYIKRLNEYLPYIHDVYLGTPVVKDFFTNSIEYSVPEYYRKCHEFLSVVKDTGLRTVIVINGRYDDIELDKKQEFLSRLFNYIREMNIHGVVCSDFIIAEELHLEFPELEINTSCNCPHYEIHHINVWRDLVGTNLVNPPRDASRNFNYLKKLKKNGYRVKLLINEVCYVNCPFLSSFCSASNGIRPCIRTHMRVAKDALNPYKSCIIFPNWLKEYDKVVDIYKITGRFASTDYIFNLLDIFAKYPERKCYMHDIVDGFPKDLDLCVDNTPISLSNCDKNCKKCGVCDKLIGNHGD